MKLLKLFYQFFFRWIFKQNIVQFVAQEIIVIDKEHLALTEIGKLLADFITENLII